MKRCSSPFLHVLAVAFVSVFVATSVAQEPAGSGLIIPQPHLALTNANVIDVRTGNVLDDAIVVIREGRIVAVGRQAPPAGVEVMNLGGRFLLPGLMDGHVHFDDVEGARRAVESGATTVKSAAVGSYRDVALRDAVREGYLAGPDILAAGVFVSPTPNPNAGLADPRLFRLMRQRVDTPERLDQDALLGASGRPSHRSARARLHGRAARCDGRGGGPGRRARRVSRPG